MNSVKNVTCGNQTAANDLDETALTPEADLKAFSTGHCLLVANKSGTRDCSCYPPCNERAYDTSVSASSPWPDVSFQQDFYRRFIANTTYAYKFLPYEYIMEAYNNGLVASWRQPTTMDQSMRYGNFNCKRENIFSRGNDFKPLESPETLRDFRELQESMIKLNESSNID